MTAAHIGWTEDIVFLIQFITINGGGGGLQIPRTS